MTAPPPGTEVCRAAGTYLDLARYPVTFRPDPGPTGWPITVAVASGPDAAYVLGTVDPEPWADNSIASHAAGLATLVRVLYDEHREAADPPGGRRLS